MRRRIKDYKILFLAIISGFPLGILYTTIPVWLREEQIDIATLTTFFIFKFSYSLKFLWFNLINFLNLKLFYKFGTKKNWMLFSIICIGAILFVLGNVTPKKSILSTYILTSSLSIFSAIFDVTFDSYRLFYMKKIELGNLKITTFSSLGHKCGFILSTFLSLVISHYYNWKTSFTIASLIQIFALLYIILSISAKNNFYSKNFKKNKSLISEHLKKALRDFFSRHNSLLVFLSIIFFKLGKNLSLTILVTFYQQLGITKIQLALFSNLYDSFVSILGIYISSLLVQKIGFYKTTLLAFCTQILLYPFFIVLNQKYKLNTFIFVVTFDGLLTGIIINLFILYLSELVNKKYMTMQYSFLMSTSSITSNFLSLFSGTWINYFGWNNYYMLIVFISIPGIIFFICSSNKKVIS